MKLPRRAGATGPRSAIVLAAVVCLLALAVLAGCGPPQPAGTAEETKRGLLADWLSKDDSKRGGTVFGGPAPTDDPDGTVMKYEEDAEDPLDRPEGEPVLIWKAGNDGAIDGGGGKPPTVKQDGAYFVTEVCAYHWNNGKGAPAGEITLKAADGTAYGPWKTTLRNEVYWIAQPNQNLPAGTYTLIDSDPPTWAQNSASGGAGMGWAYGIPVK